MGRRVALVRFESGAELYGVYRDTSDWMTRRDLYDTPELAEAARAAAEAGAGDVRQADAFRTGLASKASLRDRWLTGIRSQDEEDRPQDAFEPWHGDCDECELDLQCSGNS